MHADGRIHEVVFLGELNTGFEAGRAIPVPDGDNGFDTRSPRSRDDLLAVGVKLFTLEMGMGIDEHGREPATASGPGGTPSHSTSIEPRPAPLRGNSPIPACLPQSRQRQSCRSIPNRA